MKGLVLMMLLNAIAYGGRLRDRKKSCKIIVIIFNMSLGCLI
ncbi:MAG: hypothetical protein V7K61_13850 [Nostoc sp.]